METLYPTSRMNESNSLSAMYEELSFDDFVWYEVLKDVCQLNLTLNRVKVERQCEVPENPEQLKDDYLEGETTNRLEECGEEASSHPERSETDKTVVEDPIKENATEINLNYLCLQEEEIISNFDVQEEESMSDLCIQKEQTISDFYNQEEESCSRNDSFLENDKPWLQWEECVAEDDLLNTVFDLPDHLADSGDAVEPEGGVKSQDNNGILLKVLGVEEINKKSCKENIGRNAEKNDDNDIPKKKRGSRRSRNKRAKVSSSSVSPVLNDDVEEEGDRKGSNSNKAGGKASKRNKRRLRNGGLRNLEENGASASESVKCVSGEGGRGDPKRLYECDTCGKSFNRKADLKVHKRLHTGKGQFKCQWCEKEFLRSSFLKNHEVVHIGNNPYKCKLCPKEFSHSSYLKKHEWLHTGLKPFKCDVCDKEFSSRANLEVHKRVHTGEKPFKCDFCAKGFAQSYAKKIHERLHTGEKPLQCTYCPKTFNYSGNLKSHERAHAEESAKQSRSCVKELTRNSQVENYDEFM